MKRLLFLRLACKWAASTFGMVDAPWVSSSRILRKVGRRLEGRVSENCSIVLNRGFSVSGRVYFSLVIVRMVAVIMHWCTEIWA